MLRRSIRFSRLRTAVVIFASIAILAGAGLIALGVAGMIRLGPGDVGAATLAGSGLLAIAAAVVVIAFTWLLLKIESHSHRQYNQTIELCELITAQGRLLESMSELARISDAAKSITHREQEREAVRTAIREEMARQDWEAALNLVQQMEERFGYKEEAEGLRQQVVDARTADMRQRLNEALQRIESHWAAHDWAQASLEIDRLVRALPDDRRTINLREDHHRHRETRKNELLSLWERSVSQSGLEGDIDVDQAIDILKELDLYLSRDDARVLEQSARGVFKAKLVRFGMQFEYAVKDHRWRDAVEIGLQIAEEYPNSRMAKEFREMEGVLRQRAGLSGDVEVTARPAPASET